MVIWRVRSIKTVLTPTQLSTFLPNIEALTVLLLTLSLLTIASLDNATFYRLIKSMFVPLFGCLLCLGHSFNVFFMVWTIAAIAFTGAHLPRGKTLTIHLEATCLFAVATTLLTCTDYTRWLSCNLNTDIGGRFTMYTCTLILFRKFFVAPKDLDLQHSTTECYLFQLGWQSIEISLWKQAAILRNAGTFLKAVNELKTMPAVVESVENR